MKNFVNEVKVTYKKEYVSKENITGSLKCWELLKGFYVNETIDLIEEMNVLLLDNANHPIGYYKASVGGSTSTIFDIKLILSVALKCMAHNIIISHNHPSGNIKPSSKDITITKELQNGCRAIGINLLDHIIITNSDNYFSFADNGLI